MSRFSEFQIKFMEELLAAEKKYEQSELMRILLFLFNDSRTLLESALDILDYTDIIKYKTTSNSRAAWKVQGD